MTNPYIDYYNKQIGRGIPGFRGLRYQKGYGFLSSLIAKAIVPLFKTVRSIDPSSIVKAASDILKSPGLISGKPMADDIARIGASATGAFLNSLQGGRGYKKRRSQRKPSVTEKPPRRKQRRKGKRRKAKAKPKKPRKRRRKSKKKTTSKRRARKRKSAKFRKSKNKKRKIGKRKKSR